MLHVLEEGGGGENGQRQRDGRGITRVLTPASLGDKAHGGVLFCVHSVLEHQQQQLAFPEARS
jgi:hypothetical protein